MSKDKKELCEEEICEKEACKDTNLNEEEENSENCESEVNVEELHEEIAKLKEDILREHADYENIKKRLENEKYQAISYAHEQFARDLLPIIDALENALNSNSQEETTNEEVVKQYKEGIELTIEQFHKCFEKHDVKAVPTSGEFDPNVHEAIMKIDSEDVKSGDIVQTLQKGYTIKQRVLRPAMVSIAK